MSEPQTQTQPTDDLNPPTIPVPVSFDYPNFDSIEGLALVGNASQRKTQDGIVLRLTPAAMWQQGSAWYRQAGRVDGGFTTTFRFRLSEPGGIAAADGFSFSAQNLGSDRNVDEQGMRQQLSVQFETYNQNNIYVNNLGSTVASCSLNDLFDMRDGSVYEVVITVSYKMRLSVAIGRVEERRLPLPPREVLSNVLIQLSQFSPAFVGFGARTGAGVENHDILSWSFQGSAAPR